MWQHGPRGWGLGMRWCAQAQRLCGVVVVVMDGVCGRPFPYGGRRRASLHGVWSRESELCSLAELVVVLWGLAGI